MFLFFIVLVFVVGNFFVLVDKLLFNMKILIFGKFFWNKDEVKVMIEKFGGKLIGIVSKVFLCISIKKEVEKMNKKMEEVKEVNI